MQAGRFLAWTLMVSLVGAEAARAEKPPATPTQRTTLKDAYGVALDTVVSKLGGRRLAKPQTNPKTVLRDEISRQLPGNAAAMRCAENASFDDDPCGSKHACYWKSSNFRSEIDITGSADFVPWVSARLGYKKNAAYSAFFGITAAKRIKNIDEIYGCVTAAAIFTRIELPSVVYEIAFRQYSGADSLLNGEVHGDVFFASLDAAAKKHSVQRHGEDVQLFAASAGMIYERTDLDDLISDLTGKNIKVDAVPLQEWNHDIGLSKDPGDITATLLTSINNYKCALDSSRLGLTCVGKMPGNQFEDRNARLELQKGNQRRLAAVTVHFIPLLHKLTCGIADDAVKCDIEASTPNQLTLELTCGDAVLESKSVVFARGSTANGVWPQTVRFRRAACSTSPVVEVNMKSGRIIILQEPVTLPSPQPASSNVATQSPMPPATVSGPVVTPPASGEAASAQNTSASSGAPPASH